MFDTAEITRNMLGGFDTAEITRNMLGGFDTAEITRNMLGGLDTAEITRNMLGGLDELAERLADVSKSHELETWWTALPLQARAAVVMSLVWVCVFLRLATWSVEHPETSKYLQDHTGATPFVLATAAALAGRAVYQRCTDK